MGSENQKVLKFAHQNLSTYGIGKDLTQKQWQHIARQLIQKGLLSQEERYGSLKLTPRAYEALKNKETIYGVLQIEETALSSTKKASEMAYDPEMFEVLRQKRKAMADAEHVPPYVIFSDRTLVEMATYYPMSPDSMLKINGVGRVKFERFGQIFIGIIQQYCQARGLAEKTKLINQVIPPPNQEQMEIKPRYVIVGEAYNQGQSVTALMEFFRVKQLTILDHLEKYIQDGNPLRDGGGFLNLSRLSANQQKAVLQAFDELGAERLRPVFDRLNGAIEFDELRLVRLYYLSKQISSGS